MITETDTSTEEKIKNAARIVFTAKGFAATRTRDIADAAGINLALLNYYFGSKEKLFKLIMQESMLQFLSVIGKVVNDEKLSLLEKVTRVVEEYINMFKANPDLPFFVVTEVRNRPEEFASQMGFKSLLRESHLFRQLQKKAGKEIDPVHFLLNILSLTAFPFLAGPVFRIINGLSDEAYLTLLEERKKLIPIWIESILNTDYSRIQ
jgi:AcrR family transcriptional regulator